MYKKTFYGAVLAGWVRLKLGPLYLLSYLAIYSIPNEMYSLIPGGGRQEEGKNPRRKASLYKPKQVIVTRD